MIENSLTFSILKQYNKHIVINSYGKPLSWIFHKLQETSGDSFKTHELPLAFQDTREAC